MHQAIETVLQVRDLNTHFFTETGVVKAVNGVSFDLRRGERVAIVGESGSGKSAMAMSLIQLLPYPGKVVSGEVWVGGRNLTQLKERELNLQRMFTSVRGPIARKHHSRWPAIP